MTTDVQLHKIGLSLKKRRNVFISLVFVNIIRNMSYNSITIGLPEFVLELAGTLALYGLVTGALQITQTIFQIPLSTISDKIGRKKAIIIGYLIHLTGQALCGLSTQIWQLILFRAIQGAGVFASIIFATLTDMYDEKERAQKFSLYSVSLTVGYLIGNVVGGIITDYMKINYLFFMSAGLNFFAFLFLMLILPETNPIDKRIQDRKNRIANTYLYVKKSSKNKSLPFIFGLINHGVRSFFFSGFLAYQIWNYRNFYEKSGTQTAFILLPLVAFYVGGLMLGPILGKKIKYSLFVKITFLILAMMMIIISFSESNFWFYLPMNFILAIFMGMQDPINTSYITNHMDQSRKGLGSGIMSTIRMFTTGLGQILINVLGQILHFKLLYIISGVFLFLVVGIIFFLDPYLHKEEEKFIHRA